MELVSEEMWGEGLVTEQVRGVDQGLNGGQGRERGILTV